MIVVSEIKKSGKKADFACDVHGGFEKNVDLVTKVSRKKSEDGGAVDPTSNDVIIVDGSILTPPCDCVTSYPAWDEKNKLGFELGEAKTKDD